MLIEIHTFSFKKIHFKISSGKWRPFCLGLNVLSEYLSDNEGPGEAMGLYHDDDCIYRGTQGPVKIINNQNSKVVDQIKCSTLHIVYCKAADG